MGPSLKSKFDILGKTVLITGAGTGIGAGTVRVLANAGAENIVLTGRRPEPLEDVKEAISTLSPMTKIFILEGDITDKSHIQNLLKFCYENFGKLDILINNAGFFEPTQINPINSNGLFDDDHSTERTQDHWERTFKVNTSAPFNLINDFLPLLKESTSASVINISSTLAKKSIPATSAYNASKAALVQMTKSLALDLAPLGIRINCILPAVVDTPMFRGRFAGKDQEEAALSEAAKFHPMGRVGTPEDIGNAVLFLASPASSWITGVELPVDGGMLCT